VSLLRPIRDASPLLCYVTDRRQLPGSAAEQAIALLKKIKEAGAAGVDWIQIREKDLPAEQLSELARQALHSLPASRRLLINDRLDVAFAVGAGGVHLGENSIPVREAKRFVTERGGPNDFRIGVSVHSLQSAQNAEGDGADYVIFGPVFATPSKASYGSPRGPEELGRVCRGVSIPVLAIGGITPEAARGFYERGASGIAAIRFFQEAQNMAGAVKEFRHTL